MSASNSMPTTVVFDVGKVLIEWDPRHLYRQLFADETAMERFLAEVCTMEWNTQQDAGRSFADGVAELIERFPQWAEQIDAYDSRWDEMVPGSISASVAVLEQLATNATPLYAITNFSTEKFQRTRRRFKFFEHFKGIVVSADVGLIKPDPAIFQWFFERYGQTPEDCVFIDDSPTNIATASQLGMHAILFQSPEQLVADLKKLGLL